MTSNIYDVIKQELLTYDLSSFKGFQIKKQYKLGETTKAVFYVSKLKRFCVMYISDIKKQIFTPDRIDLLSIHQLKNYKHKPLIYKVLGLDRYKLDNPYSAMDEFKKQDDIYYGYNTDFYLVVYALYYEQNNYFEQLVKAGFLNLIYSIVNEGSPSDLKVALNRIFNVSGKNMNEITELKNYQWKLLRDIKDYELYFELKNMIKHYNPDKETIEKVVKMASKPRIRNIKTILNQRVDRKPLYDLKTLLNYMQQAKTEQGLEIDEFLEMLSAYNRMCKNIDEIPNIKSKNLERDHDCIVRRFNEYTNELKGERYNVLIKNRYEDLKYLEYEDETNIVLVPSSAQEIYEEGKNNNNCVGSYVEMHAEGITNIVFIRKKENMNSSYITVELDSGCENVVQAYYKYNKKINEADKAFIDKWLKVIQERRFNQYATT